MDCKIYSDVSIQTSPSCFLDETSQRDAAKPRFSSPDDSDITSHWGFIPEIDKRMPSLGLPMFGESRLSSSLPSQYPDFRLQNRTTSLPSPPFDERELLPQSIDQCGNRSHPRVL
jgi:hypothetical protein